MRPRSVLLLAGLAALLLWRRKGSSERVDVLYDDGSLVRLERGVEAEDLLGDARDILALAS